MAKNLEKKSESAEDPETSFNQEMQRLMAGGDKDAHETEPEPDEDQDKIPDDGIDSDSAEPEPDDETEATEDTGDEEEEPEADSRTKALVYWKKRAKAAERLATSTQPTVPKQPQKIALETLKAQLVAKGYDADTAEFMAQQSIEIQELKHGRAVSDFKADNASLLSRYPNSKSRIPEILSKMEAAGFTAEQVCVAMFGSVSSPKDTRAKLSLEDDEDAPTAGKDVSNMAARTESRREKTALSDIDLRKKQKFEDDFGVKVDNKRYLELKQDYNL